MKYPGQCLTLRGYAIFILLYYFMQLKQKWQVAIHCWVSNNPSRFGCSLGSICENKWGHGQAALFAVQNTPLS